MGVFPLQLKKASFGIILREQTSYDYMRVLSSHTRVFATTSLKPYAALRPTNPSPPSQLRFQLH